MDVLEQIETKLTSQFSINKYLADVNRWDRTVDALLKLAPAGIHYLRVDGRFDIASKQIYGDPMLDWILMVYNRIRRLGNLELRESAQVFTYTLEIGESSVTDVPLKFSTTDILDVDHNKLPKYLDGQGRLYTDVNGDFSNDLLITFTTTGAIVANSDLNLPISFFLVHREIVQDDFMAAGTMLSFPARRDIEAALKSATKEERKVSTGFGRL